MLTLLRKTRQQRLLCSPRWDGPILLRMRWRPRLRILSIVVRQRYHLTLKHLLEEAQNEVLCTRFLQGPGWEQRLCWAGPAHRGRGRSRKQAPKCADHVIQGILAKQTPPWPLLSLGHAGYGLFRDRVTTWSKACIETADAQSRCSDEPACSPSRA